MELYEHELDEGVHHPTGWGHPLVGEGNGLTGNGKGISFYSPLTPAVCLNIHQRVASIRDSSKIYHYTYISPCTVNAFVFI